MQFKIRDLMIDLTGALQKNPPELAQFCQLRAPITIGCMLRCSRLPTCFCSYFRTPCHYYPLTLVPCAPYTNCPGLSAIPCGGISELTDTPYRTPETPYIDPREIAGLKETLQQSLRAVEASEKELQPKSVEEADLLIKHLSGALDELKEIKQKLGKTK